jgi:ArsR family transcriptional regulator
MRTLSTHQQKLIYTSVVTDPDIIDVTRAATLFHALSDETRLEILDMLRDGERCVCDLQDALEAAQSRLSFHLKVLREAGLVTDRKDGRWSYYRLNQRVLEEVHDLVRALGTDGSRRSLTIFGRCCG